MRTCPMEGLYNKPAICPGTGGSQHTTAGMRGWGNKEGGKGQKGTGWCSGRGSGKQMQTQPQILRRPGPLLK